MRSKLGYMLVIGEDGAITERDLVKCQHCQRVMEIKPGTWGRVLLVPTSSGYREEPACYCGTCFAPICPDCDTGVCRPYRQQLDREEAHARALARLRS